MTMSSTPGVVQVLRYSCIPIHKGFVSEETEKLVLKQVDRDSDSLTGMHTFICPDPRTASLAQDATRSR